MFDVTFYNTFGHRTRLLQDIFPDFETFEALYRDCGIPTVIKEDEGYANFNLQTIYIILMAEYANTPIKSSDEERFKLKFMSTLYEYGPTWQREMYLQYKLLDASDEEIVTGGKAIYNHARNPGTVPNTQTLEDLPYIDDQSTTNYKKNKPDAYREIREGLTPSITKRFVDKFRPLFVNILYGNYPVVYVTEE
jgi:hypothetical protein